MPDPKYPGVYIEEVGQLPVTIDPVATAVPVFLGYTERDTEFAEHDLHLRLTRVVSLADFERRFRSPQPETNIEVAVAQSRDARGRVASAATATFRTANAEGDPARSVHILHYAMQLFFANGGGACYIVSAGRYSSFPGKVRLDDLSAALEVVATQEEPTLVVIPEAQSLALTEFAALQQAALAQSREKLNQFVVMDLHGGSASPGNARSSLVTMVDTFRAAIGTDNLRYGAVYAPNIETTIPFAYDESAIDVRTSSPMEIRPRVRKLAALASSDRTLYEHVKATIRDLPNTLPPGGAVAGVIVGMDASRGVWKAPANVALALVTRPSIAVTRRDADLMNVDANGGKSVNAIQTFTGKGTLVWGARTLAGNDSEWRYVNVRRFCSFVSASVLRGTEHAVFHHNNQATWVRLRAAVENFLMKQWRAGALAGATPGEAFFVRVGLGQTMTQLDVQEGRLIIEFGLAVMRPAEFIVLRVRQIVAIP